MVDQAEANVPALSLWQPFATLIFTGHKLHETRGFKLPARLLGREVAVHATAKFPPLRFISEPLHELCLDVFGCAYNFSLPQGAVLGTVRFITCKPTDSYRSWSGDDEAAGDWSPGRFAWEIADALALPKPYACKGRQGWWSMPPATLRALQSSNTDTSNA